MDFHKKDDNCSYKLPSPSDKRKPTRHLNNHLERNKNGISIRNRNGESSRQLSADEDYIVFCFREDGAFDVVKDGETTVHAELLNPKPSNSRPANRKVQHYHFLINKYCEQLMMIIYVLNWFLSRLKISSLFTVKSPKDLVKETYRKNDRKQINMIKIVSSFQMR